MALEPMGTQERNTEKDSQRSQKGRYRGKKGKAQKGDTVRKLNGTSKNVSYIFGRP